MILQENKRLENTLKKCRPKALPQHINIEQGKDFRVFKFITQLCIVINFEYIAEKSS